MTSILIQAALNKKKKDGTKDINQKGVGGYRPVVNWSDLSLKKKLADKQVLTCILISGTFIIIVGCILLFLGLFVINRRCPFNWLTFIDDTCLYVSGQNGTTWPYSRDFCVDQGANLVDLANDNENNKVKERLKGPTWIALFRPRKMNDFEWASGSSSTYRNWEITPSPTGLDLSQCVWMDHGSGKWHVENDCNNKYYAACEFKKSYYPLVLIGPIVMFCGVIVLILSIEICHRLRKANALGKIGLLENEELPEEDAEFVKKAIASEQDQVPSWRKNKTSPIAATTSKSPYLSPTTSHNNHAWASQEASSSRKSPSLSRKSPSYTPKKTPQRKNSKSQSDMKVPNDQSKSQERLELLLTPKSLK